MTELEMREATDDRLWKTWRTCNRTRERLFAIERRLNTISDAVFNNQGKWDFRNNRRSTPYDYEVLTDELKELKETEYSALKKLVEDLPDALLELERDLIGFYSAAECFRDWNADDAQAETCDAANA